MQITITHPNDIKQTMFIRICHSHKTHHYMSTLPSTENIIFFSIPPQVCMLLSLQCQQKLGSHHNCKVSFHCVPIHPPPFRTIAFRFTTKQHTHLPGHPLFPSTHTQEVPLLRSWGSTNRAPSTPTTVPAPTTSEPSSSSLNPATKKQMS